MPPPARGCPRRFLRYVAVDTQSDPESDSQPSAAKELNLLKMLRDELLAMGVEATLDEYGYVMASIPSNCGKDVPAVGFIAHADTAPDASGADIKPQIIENYDGGEIPLTGVPGLSLKPSEFPEMELYKGQTLITTDGTTLLGADDKAGIAEIMNAVQYIVEHPEFKHGDIKIGFTPDEEIGRGVVKFDVGNIPPKAAGFVFTANSKITGDFTVTEGAVATSAGAAESVKITFTPASMKSAVFMVPLPTGTYTGFSVKFVDGSGNSPRVRFYLSLYTLQIRGQKHKIQLSAVRPSGIY